MSVLSDPLLEEELDFLKSANLYRALSFMPDKTGPVRGRNFLDFSSNNYLGLTHHPRVVSRAGQALRHWGTGSGASRLLSGNLAIHEQLEKALAGFKKEKSAAIFSSGYLAGLGTFSALLSEKDLVVLDRLSHASLIDAARLSRAKVWVYEHLKVSELSRLLSRAQNFRRRLVVTDAYFSMDGHVAPLDELLEVCVRHGAWLMIDEAHSTGVFGDTGAGLTEHFGLCGKIPVVMGTLSKALGSVGGFVAGSVLLKETLVNRSRQFIFTTAPSPSASAAALESLKVIQEEPGLRKTLWEHTAFLRKELSALGLDLMDSTGPIIPIRIADAGKAVHCREKLKERGLWVAAVRPPTVPKGTERLRVSVSAAHRPQDLIRLLRALRSLKGILR